MVRDVRGTRQRLLEAAADEFARHGVAGARVERIAAAARTSKAQIYHHFGSKQRLFESVLDHLVTRAVDQVPFDPCDLPGYAGRLVDLYEDDARIARLATWYRLEHPGPARAAVLAEALRGGTEEIRGAQAAGLLPGATEPADLIGLVLHLSLLWVLSFPQLSSDAPGLSPGHRRNVVTDAVRSVLASPAAG